MNKWFKLLISIIISCIGLYYSFSKVNTQELWVNLSSANIIWLFFGSILLIITVIIRAFRWQIMIKSIESVKINHLFSSIMIGYFGNAVFPFRLGELLRAYSISQASTIQTTTAFGTILTERLIDMLGLISTMFFFIFLYPVSYESSQFMLFAVLITLAGLFCIFLLKNNQSHFFNYLTKFPIFKNMANIVNSIIDGLTSLPDKKDLWKIIFSTITMWFLYYLITWTVNLATGIGLNWIGVGIVLVFTSLAIAIPAAPSAIGTYHAAAIYVLTEMFLFDRLASQSFAVLLHFVGFIPLISIGAFFFISSSVRLKDISK